MKNILFAQVINMKKLELDINQELVDAISDRLNSYLNNNYGSVRQAAIQCNIGVSTLTSNLQKKNKSGPSAITLVRLKLANPEMDLDYILSGITTSNETKTIELAQSDKDPNSKLVAAINNLTLAINSKANK